MGIDILNKHSFNFNKAYGQNFIFDKNFLESIVIGIVDKNTNVVEIGAGAGTLTSILCQNAKKVVSFEIDKNLKPVLEETLAPYDNIELIFEDIMNFNIKNLEEKFDDEYVIVANLPYYITTPIIFKFLENSRSLRSMTIMVQLEVAERLVAKPGTKEYGAITPAIDYRANAKIIKKVSRKMFTPIPNVDSAIVQITFIKNKYNIENTQLLDQTIKSAFSMRRKTLANNLKNTFNLTSSVIESIYKDLNLDKNIRGETLTTKQFVELSNILNKYKSKV